MSLTLVAFLVLFMVLSFKALQHPIYGVALYFLTYFGDPAIWWWGGPISSIRWNLVASIVAILSVLLHHPPNYRKLSDAWLEIFLGLIVLNATVVHFALADSREISLKSYDAIVKFSVLIFLMKHAIRSKDDFMVLLLVLTLALGHIGYEVKVNDQGDMVKGRLENIGPPTAHNSNHLASLHVTILPLLGCLALIGKPRYRWIAFLSAPFAVNTLLLCNSRASFLAALASAPVFLVLAPPKARRTAMTIVVLGAVGTVFLLRDAKIVERFYTTFSEAEERDASAAGRVDYWMAGVQMIKDYPFGKGGDAFKKVYGKRYRVAFGHTEDVRSVHNGFINEACEWGVQGTILKVLLLLVAAFKAILLSRQISQSGSPDFGLIGAAIVAGLVAFLITCQFNDLLDNEWGLWLVALSASYEALYREGRVGQAQGGYTLYRLVKIPVQKSEQTPQKPIYV